MKIASQKTLNSELAGRSIHSPSLRKIVTNRYDTADRSLTAHFHLCNSVTATSEKLSRRTIICNCDGSMSLRVQKTSRIFCPTKPPIFPSKATRFMHGGSLGLKEDSNIKDPRWCKKYSWMFIRNNYRIILSRLQRKWNIPERRVAMKNIVHYDRSIYDCYRGPREAWRIGKHCETVKDTEPRKHLARNFIFTLVTLRSFLFEPLSNSDCSSLVPSDSIVDTR